MAENSLTCRYCGRDDIGNQGALTQHETACDHNPENLPQAAPSGGGSAPAPATRTTEASAAGERVADLGIALFDDEVDQDLKREGVRQSAGFLGGVATRVLEWRDKKKKRRRDRAERASLEESPAAAECLTEGCSYMFDEKELAQDQVSCEECGATFDVTVSG